MSHHLGAGKWIWALYKSKKALVATDSHVNTEPVEYMDSVGRKFH